MPKGPKIVNETESKVSAICQKALDKMQKKVLEHYQAHPDNAWSGHYLVDLEKTVKAVYQEMGVDIGKTFKDGLSKNMLDFYNKAAKDMVKMGRRNAILGKPNTDLVKQYMESSFEEIAMRTTKMTFDHKRALRSMAADVLRTSSLTGASREDITKEFLARAQEIPGFKFTAANGAVWSNETYFRMLARTELMNAGRAAYDDKCAKEGVDLVELSVSGHCCDACAEFEGTQFSLTGATPGVPTKQDLIDAGVFHPNCTHSYFAVPNWNLPPPEEDEDEKKGEPEEREERKAEPEEKPVQKSSAKPVKREQPTSVKPEQTTEAKKQTEAKPAPEYMPPEAGEAGGNKRTSADNDLKREIQKAEQDAVRQINEERKKVNEASAQPEAKPEQKPESEEHKKRREEFEQTKENYRKDNEKAVEDGLKSHGFIKYVENMMDDLAKKAGLKGQEKKDFIKKQTKQYIDGKKITFERLANFIVKKYDEIAAKYHKPVKVIFDDTVNQSEISPDFTELHIATAGEDPEWNQLPQCISHELAHVIHGNAIEQDSELQPKIDGSAIADWQKLHDEFEKNGELEKLKGLNSVDEFAKIVYNKQRNELSNEELYIVAEMSDTIGTIANGDGWGWGHDDEYYKAQHQSKVSFSDAFSNIWSLYDSVPHDILYRYFPNLTRIIEELKKP